MRFLLMVLVGFVLSCGDGDRSVQGPSGKVSADCSLVEIFSGKEGCQADPSLDEVPAGYVAPVDSTATAAADSTEAGSETETAPSDSTGTETGTAPSDTTGTETAPADSTEPAAETPSDTSGSELVVPEPVVIRVPVEEEPDPETARSTALTPEQARAQLEAAGIAYTGAAFRLAAQSGDLATVKLFVAAGMDLEAADDDLGWTALYEAAYAGRLATVKYLVGAGANLEARDEDGYTVLMNAAGITNNLAVVRFLVESGADVLAVGDDQRTTAWSVAMTVGNTAIADYLKSLNNAGDSVPLSPEEAQDELRRLGFCDCIWEFVSAAGDGNLEVVKLYVWTGTPGPTLSTRGVDTPVSSNETALHKAAEGGHLAVVRYLVEQGADLELKNRYDSTALLAAASRGDLAMVKVLVGAGADLEAASSNEPSSYDGFTALHWAVEGGHLAMVKVLVGAGADLEARADDGYPALHRAADGGHLAMVKVLVGAGADVKATIRHDNTARDVARSRGHTAIVSYFDSLDADADE